MLWSNEKSDKLTKPNVWSNEKTNMLTKPNVWSNEKIRDTFIPILLRTLGSKNVAVVSVMGCQLFQ